MPIDRLQTHCEFCGRYYLACCHCEPASNICHAKKVVYTDGACSNNGDDSSAISAIGGTLGDAYLEYNWSIKIDDSMDYGQRRTSQRAELLAAIEGLRHLVLEDDNDCRSAGGHLSQASEGTDGSFYVVATDSEYVVKGVTQWYPKWQRNGWRTAGGTRPTNLDLFRELVEYVEDLEKNGITVKFWYIPRRYNREADALATAATRD
ncbi:ribonuclease H-like protein [Cylindrobasidium torrendii FP15055 ss-10]|uniref:ribonuclease H n=1 Tax=Cylindrobasidium torrendii FP15055 ss-10 TaxID=1314674 RepID=A0A0D7B3B3_9AGAR|nr:ribonuclease H-like protein [Cylindrobasidium torrendii FP15055 ss-10]